MVANVSSDTNWATNYFASIKGVCPWSYKAHMKDNILFIEGGSDKCFGTWANVYKASTREAFVFIMDKTSDELLDICESMKTNINMLNGFGVIQNKKVIQHQNR